MMKIIIFWSVQMKVHLTKHGKERLYERVYKKSQHKTLPYALNCIEKVLERGVITVNDSHQMLVVYAQNLYVFKKKMEELFFVTVKTCHEHRLGVYLRGEKRTVSSKKNFLLCE